MQNTNCRMQPFTDRPRKYDIMPQKVQKTKTKKRLQKTVVKVFVCQKI